MFARMVRLMTALGGLLCLAAVLWLPLNDGHGEVPEPPSSTSELAILPGDCPMFVTMQLGHFRRDALATAFGEGTRMWEFLQRDLGLEVADIERFTIVAGEGIEIIRTRKPLDRKKLLAGLERRSPRYYGKDKEAEKRAEVSEKKVGSKTVYYYGRPQRWTSGLCILDKNVVVRGNMTALEELLGSKVKQTPQLKALIAEAGKHSLGVAFQGKELCDLFRRQMSKRYYSGPDEIIAPGGIIKEKDKGDKEKRVKEEKEADGPVPIPFEAMPYKPLLMARTAIVTLDFGDGYTARARGTFANKEATDEAEHALKTLLYVVREMAVMLPHMERGMRPLAPVTEPVQKAFKAAKIVRKGNTLETSVSLTISGKQIKQVRKELAEERKREEERRKQLEEKRKRREEEFRKFREKDKDKG
jgi:hypothetical protein